MGSSAWPSVKWRPFKYGEDVYDLSHVHPFNWSFVMEERKYDFTVAFSHHVFTSSPKKYPYDEKLIYQVSNSNEERCFCTVRYGLSKRLIDVVQSLDVRQCFNTGKGNFFTLDVPEIEGVSCKYEVYFDVIRVGRGNQLRLSIQSAYVRDASREKDRPKLRKIRLSVIARNKLSGKKITTQA